MIFQTEIKLKPRARGYFDITEEVVQGIPEIKQMESGILNVFIKHTSASIMINENADSTVMEDMEQHLNRMVPENQPYYRHTYEGPDDMPAHIKAALIGNSLQIPITNGRLNLGTWQGIFLGEHRNYGGVRKLVLTVSG
jgi:secondary thiamine-phosphate synthase enzyme